MLLICKGKVIELLIIRSLSNQGNNRQAAPRVNLLFVGIERNVVEDKIYSRL